MPDATALPLSVAPSRSSTVVPGSAVPLNATVFVISSALSLGDVTTGALGAVVSTTNVRDAGVGSGLPAASIARTANVCEPCERPV